MRLVLQNFAYNAGGWRVEKHPRFLADVTGDGTDDIVGFGDGGVWISQNNGDGTFGPLRLAIANFGYTAGGWRVEKHPRFVTDLTGDGRADLVGFGDGGVWVALNNADGTFGPMRLVVADFGYVAGGWRVEKHPRFLADVTGDGRPDIVAFGDGGVWVALNNGNGTFAAPKLAVANFGHVAGGWRVERHPRFVVDVTGDGRADLVGFGDGGVWISRSNGDGTFPQPTLAVANFAYTAGGWRVEKHPRVLADTTGDGRPDIVGFGDGGVWISRNNGNGTFPQPTLAVANFGHAAGGWRVDRHPRIVADVTGDGRADIVGFGDAGVYTSLNAGNGTFPQPTLALADFAYVAGGWRVERHPRVVADVTGDGRPDLVGFGDGGVWVAVNNGNGTFKQTYIRRDIWKLQETTAWDPVTLAYAKAIKAMQARPLTDPTSWAYQAAIHGRDGAVPPGAAWNECQHGSWYFLPWHRMYLYYFERIVRAEVIRQGGPRDWALPYWNYDIDGRRALPPAFRQPTMPDGSANPLFVTQRNPSMNTGSQLPPAITSSTVAMAQTQFTPPGMATGFGGGRSVPSHFFGAAGRLEITPHADVHSTVGGWMGLFNFAALDPIFWLHHANIDRLWTEWLEQGGGRVNPAEAAWRDPLFTLHDETGADVKIASASVLDTDAQLSYVYDTAGGGTADPTGGAAAARSGDAGDGADEPLAELVGASDRPVTLSGGTASVDVRIDRRTADTVARERNRPPLRVFLNLEDIEAEANPTTVYEVFVTVADPSGDETTPHYVGNVSFFGIEHSAQSRSAGGGDPSHGLRRTFDVSAWIDGLREADRWTEDRIRVSFRPIALIPPADADPGPVDDEESRRAATLPVRLGRVSVFYE